MTSSSFTGEHINTTARGIFAALGSIMIVCGVLGNGFLIMVIFRSFRKKRCVHNLFIANLALIDILTLGYWFSFFVLDLILGYHPVVNHTHCVVNGVMIGIFSVASTISLISISLNRYLHVCHSHLYSRIFTLPRTIFFCLLAWILGIILTLPPAFEVGGSYHYNALTHICSFKREKLTYSKIMVLLFSTVPVLFIGYWNFAIFQFWRKVRMNISSRYPQLCTVNKKWRQRMRREEDPEVETDQEIVDGFKNCPCAGNGQNSKIAVAHLSEHFDNNENDSNISESKEIQNDHSVVAIDDIRDMKQLTNEMSKVAENVTKKCSTLSHDTAGTGIENTATANPSPRNCKPASSSLSLTFRQTCSPPRRQKHYLNTAVQNLQQQRRKQKAREVAFVRSLLVVFILMFVCFIPYGITILVTSYITIPPEAVIVGEIFLFTNNTINWIVYGVMNSVFRKGYVKCLRHLILTCCRIDLYNTDRILSASQSSLTTVSKARFDTENDLEQSCASQATSGVL